MKKYLTVLLIIILSASLYAKMNKTKKYQRFFKKCVSEIDRNKEWDGIAKVSMKEATKGYLVSILSMEQQGMGAMAKQIETTMLKPAADHNCPKASKRYLKIKK